MTTETTAVGSAKRLTFTFTDVDGNAANPTTIALTIREPDGAETAKTKADMTSSGNSPTDGVWYYDFQVTKEGRHHIFCDGGGAVDAAGQCEFYALRKTTS